MKTRSSTTLIIISVIALAAVVGYYYSYRYVQSLDERTLAASHELESLETKHTQALSLQAVANSGRDEQEKLDAYIINKGEEISVVKSLEKLAENLSLSFVAETIDSQDDEAVSSQGKDLLHIAIATKGSLQQNRRFLSLLETLPYNVKLNKVDLVDTSGEAAGARVWQGSYDIGIVEEKEIVSNQ